MSEDRLSHLEARFAWLERHVAEQDRAMVGLLDDVRRLREELRRLQLRSQGGPESAGPETESERPPHY